MDIFLLGNSSIILSFLRAQTPYGEKIENEECRMAFATFKMYLNLAEERRNSIPPIDCKSIHRYSQCWPQRNSSLPSLSLLPTRRSFLLSNPSSPRTTSRPTASATSAGISSLRFIILSQHTRYLHIFCRGDKL